MRKLFNYLPLIILLGASSAMVSCKKDEMENIVLKQTGSVKATFLNGEQPVANTKVNIYNASNNGLIEIVTTDESGIINLQNFVEGNYYFSFEINDPSYVAVRQDFQVLSGNNKEQNVQIKEHIGSLTYSLVNNINKAVITEDMNIGLALVPNSISYKKALTDKEKISHAKEIKFFDTAGKLDFNDVPTGSYNVIRVNAAKDSIISYLSSVYIDKGDLELNKYEVNVVQEQVNANSFEFVSMTAVNYAREEIVELPLSTARVFKKDGNYIFEGVTNEDVTFTSKLYLYSDNSYSTDENQSSNSSYWLTFDRHYEDKIEYINGELVLRVRRIDITDYSNFTSTTNNYYDVVIKFKK